MMQVAGGSVDWVSIKALICAATGSYADVDFQGIGDLNGAKSVGYQVVWLKNGLTSGTHTFQIRVRGAATGTTNQRVVVTGFITLT